MGGVEVRANHRQKVILKPGWRLECSPGKDKKQIEREGEEVEVGNCCGRRKDQGRGDGRRMGGFIGGRGGGRDGEGGGCGEGEKKDLLICKIEKIGYKKQFGSGGAVNGEKTGWRWSRDDERAEELTREKIL